jgi:hypothetical protein
MGLLEIEVDSKRRRSGLERAAGEVLPLRVPAGVVEVTGVS